MNKKHVILVLLLFVLASSAFITYKTQTQKMDEVHYHAGFKVVIDGKIQDYSDLVYMSIIPCGESDEHEKQEQNVHLHDSIGDVVHVHAPGVTWSDFFESIEVDFNTMKPALTIKNGEKVDGVFDRVIEPYESIVIVSGESDPSVDYASYVVTKEHIQKVEETSELCGS